MLRKPPRACSLLLPPSAHPLRGPRQWQVRPTISTAQPLTPSSYPSPISPSHSRKRPSQGPIPRLGPEAFFLSSPFLITDYLPSPLFDLTQLYRCCSGSTTQRMPPPYRQPSSGHPTAHTRPRRRRCASPQHRGILPFRSGTRVRTPASPRAPPHTHETIITRRTGPADASATSRK